MSAARASGSEAAPVAPSRVTTTLQIEVELHGGELRGLMRMGLPDVGATVSAPLTAHRPGAPAIEPAAAESVNSRATPGSSEGHAAGELLSAKTERYEVHAPDPADVERGRQGVEHAMAEYERIFGEPAPPLVFVLFGSNEQAAAYRSRFDGRLLQSWPSTTRRTLPTMAWEELGLVFREEPDGRAATTLYDAAAPLTGLRDGDIVTAINASEVTGVSDIARIVAGVDVGQLLTFHVRRSGAPHSVEVVRAPRQQGQQAPMHILAAAAVAVPTSMETIAHEAMHRLVAGRYGADALLPPWLSEGLASFIEPLTGGEPRYWNILHSRAAGLVPLQTLLSMPHPASSGVPLEPPRGNTIRLAVSGGSSSVMLYPQSMALLMYIAEAEGVRYLGRLSDAIAGRRTLESVLAESRTLPHDVDALDLAFRQWLKGRGVPLS